MAKKAKDKIVDAFMEIGSSHNLPENVVQDALAEAMEKAYQKQTNIKDMKVRTEFKNGQLHIYHVRDVVDDVEDDELQIEPEDAQKFKPGAKAGDTIEEEVDYSDFDRAAIVLAKNVMKQKIREAEKAIVYENYQDKVGDLVTGIVCQVEDKFALVRLGGTPDGKMQNGSTDAMMKHSAQIPTEEYREGSPIQVVITEVNKESKGALVMVSRSDNDLIKRLFEKEVPEIYNGIIEIKSIARDPGARAKIAVYSHNENIDPIGACIGPRGTRVQAIINELNGEKIDILEWSDDLQKLVANALAPAQEVVVIPNENVKNGLYAVVPDNQLSLAIGKRGQNARLAVKLTNHKIDIKSQSQMEELGIDYKTLYQAMQDEYQDKLAKERAYKQQKRIDELRSSTEDGMDIDSVAFTYTDELEPDDQHLSTMETLASVSELPAPEQPALLPEEAEPAAAAVQAPVQEKKLDEMEEAARLAKEQRKSLADRRAQYTPAAPKAEQPAPAAAKPAEKEAPVREAKPAAKKPFKKKPTFAAMQPIYTEEELRQIEEQEYEEEMSASWNEDVDYEEYDEYYDDEY